MKVRRLPVDPGPAAWNTILPPADRYPQQQGFALQGGHCRRWVCRFIGSSAAD